MYGEVADLSQTTRAGLCGQVLNAKCGHEGYQSREATCLLSCSWLHFEQSEVVLGRLPLAWNINTVKKAQGRAGKGPLPGESRPPTSFGRPLWKLSGGLLMCLLYQDSVFGVPKCLFVFGCHVKTKQREEKNCFNSSNRQRLKNEINSM